MLTGALWNSTQARANFFIWNIVICGGVGWGLKGQESALQKITWESWWLTRQLLVHQCTLAAKKGKPMLGCVSRTVACRPSELILPLCSALVRPHLENHVLFWALCSRKEIDTSESSEGSPRQLEAGAYGLWGEAESWAYSHSRRRLRGIPWRSTANWWECVGKIEPGFSWRLHSDSMRSKEWEAADTNWNMKHSDLILRKILSQLEQISTGGRLSREVVKHKTWVDKAEIQVALFWAEGWTRQLLEVLSSVNYMKAWNLVELNVFKNSCNFFWGDRKGGWGWVGMYFLFCIWLTCCISTIYTHTHTHKIFLKH